MCCFPRPRVWKPFFVWCLVVPCWDASKFRGERGATTVARPHACCRPRFARPAASQVLDVEAAVEDYIPSFAREWSVVESPPSEGTEASEIEYNSFLTGKTSTLKCKTSQVGISAAPRRTPPHLLHLLQAPRVDLVAAGNRAVDVGVRGSFEPNPNPTAFRIPPPLALARAVLPSPTSGRCAPGVSVFFACPPTVWFAAGMPVSGVTSRGASGLPSCSGWCFACALPRSLLPQMMTATHPPSHPTHVHTAAALHLRPQPPAPLTCLLARAPPHFRIS